jgi:glycosyltransferase involved in cell wall biosynthesis
MNAKPLVSVQMLAYNHAPHIRKAVEGVISQRTDFPFELIIGEDCSTDGTRDIVFGYERAYPEIVRVVTSEENVGMHRNVLRTQEACRGDILAFCEGDDFWHDPLKLQTEVDFLVQNPEYGLTHCNYDTYEVATGRLRRNAITCQIPLQDDRAYVEVLLRRRRIMTLTVCVRRNLLEAVVREQPECTDETWPMGDTQRWLEICRLTKVKYFPKAMATYNFLEESASQSRDPVKAFRFTEKAGELIFHYLKKYPIQPELEKQVRQRIGREVLAMAYLASDRDKASYWLRQLRETAHTVPMDAYLYYLGTAGACGALAAKPGIWLLSNGRKFTDKVREFSRRYITKALNRGDLIGRN